MHAPRRVGAQLIAAPRATVIVIVRVQQAIAQHVSDTRGIDVTEDMVVVGPGCKPGLFFATMALVEKGDEVICPDPGFPT